MVSGMSETSKSCSSTSTTSTRPSPTSGYVIFSKTHMTHVLYPIFREKSIGNGLRYVRGLQVMLIDVDNVNQAESHKWVRHILKNTYDTCFISNFWREIDWVWSQICEGPQSLAHRRRQRQPSRVPQVGMSYFKNHAWHMFYIQFFLRRLIKKWWSEIYQRTQSHDLRGWQMSAQMPTFDAVRHDTEVCWYLKYGIFLKKNQPLQNITL